MLKYASARLRIKYRWFNSSRCKINCMHSNFSVCSSELPVLFTPSWKADNLALPEMADLDCILSYSVVKHTLPWLACYGPEFRICGKDVHVLKEPSEFFEKLKELAKSATKRIVLASLYIGTGPLEQELVSCIHEELSNPEKELKAKILLDFTRGSRGKQNSRTLLLPLLRKFPEKVQVSLYHTPKLRGWIKWLLPERWNETIGLSHLKVYLFDDTLLLSGANLSDQYFTNRQDRYVLFHNCKELANFFDDLVSTVSTFSFQLEPNNTTTLHPKWDIHPLEGNFNAYVEKANKSIQSLLQPSSQKYTTELKQKEVIIAEDGKETDTVIYPLIQMYTLGITQDEKVTRRFLMNADPFSHIKLASGYFNLTDHYMNIILKLSKASYSLLVASPKVNGFYGAAGLAGAIPTAYTYIAKQFYERILQCHQYNRIALYEYERAAWTFHVKGLWYYKPQESLPSATLIGSPNFGYRSVYRDLEAQVALVTTNNGLKEQLHKEQQRFFQCTTPVESSIFEKPERHVPLWVKLVTPFIKAYF